MNRLFHCFICWSWLRKAQNNNAIWNWIKRNISSFGSRQLNKAFSFFYFAISPHSILVFNLSLSLWMVQWKCESKFEFNAVADEFTLSMSMSIFRTEIFFNFVCLCTQHKHSNKIKLSWSKTIKVKSTVNERISHLVICIFGSVVEITSVGSEWWLTKETKPKLHRIMNIIIRR